jgi:hypothetical protein
MPGLQQTYVQAPVVQPLPPNGHEPGRLIPTIADEHRGHQTLASVEYRPQGFPGTQDFQHSKSGRRPLPPSSFSALPGRNIGGITTQTRCVDEELPSRGTHVDAHRSPVADSRDRITEPLQPKVSGEVVERACGHNQ